MDIILTLVGSCYWTAAIMASAEARCNEAPTLTIGTGHWNRPLQYEVQPTTRSGVVQAFVLYNS